MKNYSRIVLVDMERKKYWNLVNKLDKAFFKIEKFIEKGIEGTAYNIKNKMQTFSGF